VNIENNSHIIPQSSGGSHFIPGSFANREASDVSIRRLIRSSTISHREYIPDIILIITIKNKIYIYIREKRVDIRDII